MPWHGKRLRKPKRRWGCVRGARRHAPMSGSGRLPIPAYHGRVRAVSVLGSGATVLVRLGPLAEQRFRRLFLGRTISQAGSAIAPVAVAFAVLDLTGSAADLGYVLAARVAPQVLFVVAGGVWADRFRRHRVMLAANLLSGLSQAATAALLLTGHARLWHLMALAAGNGVAAAIFFPASQGIVPEVVSPGQLQQANALLRLSQHGTLIAGSAVGGLLVAATGPGCAIAIDAASFFVSAAVLAGLQLPPAARMQASSFLAELREGWGEFWSRTWLWAVVVQFMFVNAAWSGAFSVLGPVTAKEELGGAVAWGFILAGESAGLVLGGLLGLRLTPRRPLLVGTLAVFLALPLLAALALHLSTWVVALAAFIQGVGIEQFSVQWSTALHQHVPLDRLSRVSSYDALGSFVFIPVGYALVGPIAGVAGVTATIWGAAGVIAVATAAALLSAELRQLERTDAPSAAARTTSEDRIGTK
jgi:MFS family permease